MKKYKIIFSLIILLIFLLELFFPISPDISIFLLGGRAIADGQKIFVDFIDLKQPIIYYIFSFIYNIFGSNELQIRIFDILYQILTVIALGITVKKRFDNELLPYIAGLIYSSIYINQQYFGTYQVESFIGLPLIIIILLLSAKIINNKEIIISGLLFGFIISLKITFAVLFLFIILYFLILYDFKDTIKKIIIFIFSIILSFTILLFPLINLEIRNGFFEILQFLSIYSNIPPISLKLIQEGIKHTGIFFGDNLSLFVIFSSIYSVTYFIKYKKNEKILILSYLLIIGLLLTVFIEKKYFEYHYSRLYSLISIISAVGILEFWSNLAIYFRENKKKSIILLVFFIPLTIIFSPVPRTLNQLKNPFYYITNFEKYLQNNEVAGDIGKRKWTLTQIKNYLLRNKTEKDKILIVSHGAQELNFLFKSNQISRFAHSAFYFSIGKSPKWQELFFEELKKSNYFLISSNQNTYLQLGFEKSDEEILKKDERMNKYIEDNYEICFKIDEFSLYRRIHHFQ